MFNLLIKMRDYALTISDLGDDIQLSLKAAVGGIRTLRNTMGKVPIVFMI